LILFRSSGWADRSQQGSHLVALRATQEPGRDGDRVRCFTKNGHDWTDRLPAIVDAALRIEAASFLIDGEAVVVSDDGRPASMRSAPGATVMQWCCTPST